MTRSRIIPKLTVSTASGSDPNVIEIEDCRNVYGDNVIEMFPEIDTPCLSAKAPAGQCEYSIKDRFTCCIHCGKASGLDR